jgi:hypothetical protein
MVNFEEECACDENGEKEKPLEKKGREMGEEIKNESREIDWGRLGIYWQLERDGRNHSLIENRESRDGNESTKAPR